MKKHPDRPPLQPPKFVEPALDLQPQFPAQKPKHGDRHGSYEYVEGRGWVNPEEWPSYQHELNHPINWNQPNDIKEGDIRGGCVYRDGIWHPLSNLPPKVYT